MSKPTTLGSFLATFFGRSEKAISEKLSTEEHNEFTADVTALNDQLETQISENTRITGELSTATTRISDLETSLSAAEGQVTTLTSSLQTMTGERDKYKGHYDEAAKKGDKSADQDQNSRGASGKTGYNDNAMAVWQKVNG